MNSLGVVVSLVVIIGGLLAFLFRSLSGKELDRRFIYLFVFLAVAAPLLFPITFPEKITPVVETLFDRIEMLPSGSKVLLSYDFDPAMAPEVQPMADAISRHCLAKGHRVVYMSLWATGLPQIQQTITGVISTEFSELQDGVGWANVGYKAGNEGVLKVIATDFKKMFTSDIRQIPADSLRILDGIENAGDFDLAIEFGGGKPGPMEWVLFVGDPAGLPLGVGVAAVSAPQLYPYYPKQLVGILGGIKGAAEYESELRRVHARFEQVDAPGLRRMGPQTLVHIVVMSLIVIGNVVYFRSRRSK